MKKDGIYADLVRAQEIEKAEKKEEEEEEAVRGMTFPVFSIIYGKMFKVRKSVHKIVLNFKNVLQTLTAGTNDQKLHGAMMNAIWFTILGVSTGCSTMLSGFLFGRAGESFTRRLRMSLFTNIIKQDGEYFDHDDHASGKLTTRLSTDAPNIRAVTKLFGLL
ncbi:unnamed protein product [Cylicostephanus goldi]|uniref:ABC transmembrane type-1 domain-containing protein n=1 Tax=Cylicostephanus goldi TaxID=71465 RepID=A0A3P7MKM0_CYLGO|nr:unnamed protein product [Cylicostephanus goldi]